MEEEARFLIQDSWFRYSSTDDDKCTTSSSIGEDSSIDSKGTSSETETNDDASSSETSSSSSAGALNDLSDIMNQLPIKRGLSKFYHGKSESFVSLSSSITVEDLAKKTVAAASPYRRRVIKVSKSCGSGFNYKAYTLPKATIAKRGTAAKNCCFSTAAKRHSFGNAKSGLSHLHPNLEF